MKSLMRSLMALAIILLSIAPVAGQESAEGSAPAMPEMGPPKQMGMLSDLVGDWTYHGKWRMDPTQDWVENDATATFKFVAGGAALQMDYTGMMMGAMMYGLSLTTYDRDSGKWQSIWTDNFGAKISYYEGTFKNGRLENSGEDIMQGAKIYTRTAYFDITKKTMQWVMENSLDGETWFVSMEGTYTRK